MEALKDSPPRSTRRLHRVLVVDDHPDTLDVICIILKFSGHETRRANSGRSAIAEAYAFDPTVVILDMSLPDMSGLEVAKALRQRPGSSAVHIAAFSGWDGRENRDAAFAAGCDQYVLKPADAEKIRGILKVVEDIESPPICIVRDET